MINGFVANIYLSKAGQKISYVQLLSACVFSFLFWVNGLRNLGFFKFSLILIIVKWRERALKRESERDTRREREREKEGMRKIRCEMS